MKYRIYITENLIRWNLNRPAGTPKKRLKDLALEVFDQKSSDKTKIYLLYRLNSGKCKNVPVKVLLNLCFALNCDMNQITGWNK